MRRPSPSALRPAAGDTAWIAAAVGAVVVMATGLLPRDGAVDVLAQLAPVLVFLVGITLIAEIADLAGVFEVAAHRVSVWGRGRVLRLWLLVVALATATTILLSLDTTAVLLTPVVLALTQRLGLIVLPFAMATVWLANTASLLLPVSNLTNLLSQRRTSVTAAEFAGRMWLPAVVAVTITVLVLWVRYRRSLTGRYELGAARPPVPDRLMFWAAAGTCACVGPLTLAGVPVSWSAAAGAAALTALHLTRRGTSQLTPSLVPWRLVVLVAGLFLVVGAAQAHGLDDLLRAVTSTGSSVGSLLQLTGVSALAANLVNNLPAYAALEPVAGAGERTYALLLGVNLGPLVLLWGSLATLLWRDRCHAGGVRVSWQEFAVVGVVGVPLLLVATTAALTLTA